jgi:hypothetical protein
LREDGSTLVHSPLLLGPRAGILVPVEIAATQIAASSIRLQALAIASLASVEYFVSRTVVASDNSRAENRQTFEADALNRFFF